MNNISFGARVRIQNVDSKIKNAKELSIGSSSAGAYSASVSGFPTSVSAGLGSQSAGISANTVGSAFFAKASGINSSGIVPGVIESATPYVTPATVASANNHPSTMGSFFSSVGSWLNSFVKINHNNIKRPS